MIQGSSTGWRAEFCEENLVTGRKGRWVSGGGEGAESGEGRGLGWEGRSQSRPPPPPLLFLGPLRLHMEVPSLGVELEP